MNDSFDLVVIGAGPAGEKGAAQAAYYNKTVALVEVDEAGAAKGDTTVHQSQRKSPGRKQLD